MGVALRRHQSRSCFADCSEPRRSSECDESASASIFARWARSPVRLSLPDASVGNGTCRNYLHTLFRCCKTTLGVRTMRSFAAIIATAPDQWRIPLRKGRSRTISTITRNDSVAADSSGGKLEPVSCRRRWKLWRTSSARFVRDRVKSALLDRITPPTKKTSICKNLPARSQYNNLDHHRTGDVVI